MAVVTYVITVTVYEIFAVKTYMTLTVIFRTSLSPPVSQLFRRSVRQSVYRSVSRSVSRSGGQSVDQNANGISIKTIYYSVVSDASVSFQVLIKFTFCNNILNTKSSPLLSLMPQVVREM